VKGGIGRGLEPISYPEFLAIRSGKKPGVVLKGKVGVAPAFFKRKFAPRGMVGWAMRHPALAVGGSALAYLMLSSPMSREVASGLAPSLPSGQLRQDVYNRFSEPPVLENPLARQVWG